MKKNTARIVVNAILAAAVFVVWILNFVIWKGSWNDLRYFTVLSNLLAGVTAVLWIVVYAVKRRTPVWLTILKYLATVSVFVTFLVILAFLGPIHGYGKVYHGTNLYYHLFIPLFAIAEEIVFGEEISFKQSLFAIAPPIVYGIGYLTNCLVNGIGEEWATRNDWYGFLLWGYGVGVLIFVVICAISWGLGLVLRALKRLARKISWAEDAE